MKSIWNLVVGSICLFAALMDYFLLGMSGLTLFNAFMSGANFVYYIADKTFAVHAKSEGGKDAIN